MRAHETLLLLVLAACTGSPQTRQRKPAVPTPTAGIWYSTWYTNRVRYLWTKGNGLGASRKLVGDVNGDGRSDALEYYGSGRLAGSWHAALSTGKVFANWSQWTTGHGVGSTWQGLADVDGDQRADAVVFFGEGDLAGSWYVALSAGKGFENWSRWTTGHGVDSTWQGLADVDGDQRADAVVFFGEGELAGNWYAALSSGTGFANWSRWTTGHGVGSTWQGLADVDGDQRADAVVFFGEGDLAGSWYVAPSTGKGFENWSQWTPGHGVGSAWQGLADVDGDGRADALVYFAGGNLDANWYAAPSTGSQFGGNAIWRSGHHMDSTWRAVGDATGDGTLLERSRVVVVVPERNPRDLSKVLCVGRVLHLALAAGDQPYSMLMVSMTDFIAALTISVSGSRTMTYPSPS